MPLKDKLMIAVLLFGGINVFMCQTMLSPAFPAIMNDFDIDAATVQWLASAYTLAMAVVVPANAYLLGRFTVRNMYFFCMMMFVVGCAVSFAAPVFPVVLVGRIVQGLMAGAMMPMVITSVVTMFPEERRGMSTGIISLSISIAPAIGPALAGMLIDFFGWRSLFAFLALFSLFGALASRATVFDRITYGRVPLDMPSAVLMVFGMSTLLYGASSLSSSGSLVVSIAALAIGVVLTVVFVRRQNRLEFPFLKVNIFTIVAFGAACSMMALANAALICTEAVLPIYIQSVLGHSAFVSGMAILPAVLAGLPFALLSGRIFDKHGIRGVALIGGVLLVVGAAALLFYTPATSVVLVSVLFILMQVGIQMLFAPSQAWGLNALTPEDVPHGSSLFSTFEQLGSSFGIAIIMGLTTLPDAIGMDTGGSAFPGVHLGFIGCFCITVIIFAIILVFTRKRYNS